jgi:hypothetical protein
LVERLNGIQEVVGSIPISSTTQKVENSAIAATRPAELVLSD